MSSLTTLPLELFLSIISFLPAPDILKMRQICRKLDSLIFSHTPSLLSSADLTPWSYPPTQPGNFRRAPPHPDYATVSLYKNSFAILMTDDLVTKLLLEHVLTAKAANWRESGGTRLVRAIQLMGETLLRMAKSGGGVMREGMGHWGNCSHGNWEEEEENYRMLWRVPCMTVVGFKGRQWVMDELLHQGKPSDNLDEEVDSVLVATYYSLRDSLNELLEDGGDPNICHPVFGTPIYTTAFWNDHHTARLLIDHGANIKASHGFYYSPLQVAAYRGSENVVDQLLAAGADLDDDRVRVLPLMGRIGGYGSPLGAAAAKGHLSVVKLLIYRNKTDINTLDNHFRSPLWWAVRGGHLHVVRELVLKRSHDIDINGSDSASPLYEAMELGHHKIVQFLCAQPGARVNLYMAMARKSPPLHWAVQYQDEELVRILLERRDVDPNIYSPVHDSTPLYHAVDTQQLAIVRLLLQRGDVDPNRNTQDGRPNRTSRDWMSPLIRAVSLGNAEIVELLLARRDIDPNRGNPNGGDYATPLGIAVARQDERIVRMLMEHPGTDCSAVDAGRWY